MNQKGSAPILIVLLIAVATLSGYLIYSNYSNNQTKTIQDQVACTQDAKLCPDGTSVGRTGPNCDFSPCPLSSEASIGADLSIWEKLTSTCGFSIQYPKGFDAEDRIVINEQDPSHSEIDSICAIITAPDHVGYLGEEAGLIIRINRFRIGSKVNSVVINSINDYIRAIAINQPVGNQLDKTYGNLKGKYFTTSGYFVDANFVFIEQNYVYEISWDSYYDGQYKNYIDQILSTFRFD